MSTNKEINTRIKLKRDTESNWDSKNPTILNGELVIVDGNDGRLRAKIGNGTSTYQALGFIDHIHVITEDNKQDPIPENAIVIIDTTEDDLTGSITGSGSNSGTGVDGYSPTVTVSTITGGHRVIIKDVNGIKTFDVMDGKDGHDGQDGKSFTYADFTADQLAALKGEPGDTPVKGTDYWTVADKAEIVNDVLAALPNGNEVAY